MKLIYDSKFKTDVALIGQGEYHVSNDGRIITTTLGSCISVCLFDKEMKVGAMNHYMLPGPVMEREDIVFGKAKYGINSMEIIINELMKVGGRRDHLEAKIFGGANMFKGKTGGEISELITVGEQNITFAKKYLAMEKIRITKEDVGGDHARKVYFDPAFGVVKLFRIGVTHHDELRANELKYRQTIKQRIEKEKTEEHLPKDIEDKITFF